ncbi:fimbrial biogenesis chaperone [Biostraticola tofi]|uniref:Fimbrial chaperone protein n=1 Tax=Biostraticola tofi TaxID=466109 RepID=A0A4R3YLC6_9GAMM|nr:molecular chaperone [Biostraticola tofi]TCV93076.1 fimbrial chaperone protein [Biostraticola tofi]
MCIDIVFKYRLSVLLALAACQAQAGHSILIWPVDPKIEADQKATELWVDNKGVDTALIQVRIFHWQQANGSDRYDSQQHIVASPPMLRLEPGQKQLVRLVKNQSPLQGQEQAYRVLLDEIPTIDAHKQDSPHSLHFQMRFSIPLFVYGSQSSSTAENPILYWRIKKIDKKPMIEITNLGRVHARLSKASLGGHTLNDGLFGYVLAQSSYLWPLNFTAGPDAEFDARIDNRQRQWRSLPAAR